MKPQGAHAHEDRLLDFAYDELPAPEARLVEQHLQGCSRCTEQLQGIRGVRSAMSRLTPEPVPDAGLDSLLAYAQQSARRSAEGAQPSPRWWRRLLTPALGVAAMSVFGLVVLQVDREVDLSPSLHQNAPTPAAPTPAAPAPIAAAEPMDSESAVRQQHRASAVAPAPVKTAPSSSMRADDREDWSNAGAGSAGGFPEKKAYDANRDASADDEGGRVARGSGKAPMKSKRMVASGPGQSASVYAGAPQRERKDAAFAEESLGSMPKEAPGAPATLASEAAAPPPPPAAPSMAEAAPVQRMEQEARKPEPASKAEMPMRRSLSAGEILTQADIAHREGDWAEEVAFLRAALTSGVQGARRLDVLSRLCEAEFAQNNRRAAIEVCKQVVTLAPGSSEARSAQKVLERAQAPAN